MLRVQADDPTIARAIARALVSPLRERGARVLLDGAPQGGGSGCGVHILTTERGGDGAAVSIGVSDEDAGARWLAPLDVPPEPTGAVTRVVAFLEQWGFIASPRRVRAAP
ncbi:MAG TPA: hypothetical protein VM582_09175 [Candidatus Thermoplasmatota archaeon]|nr:hypothetical protein [Candidatus Thermoplasmatota archaeon]